MTPPRVTHLTTVHRALDTRIFEKECRAMAAAGYEVHLVCAAPPAGQLGGVRLHEIAREPGRPRARDQAIRVCRTARHALWLRPSVFHLHDPHLIPLGLLLKARGATVVYDVHEDYPAHARTKLFGRRLRAELKALMWRVLEATAKRRFDGFVCASEALAESFPRRRTVTVTNYPKRDDLGVGDAVPYEERANIVVYTGLIREERSWWEITRAIQLVPAALDSRLLVVGEFRHRCLREQAVADPGWKRVDFHPWRAHGELGDAVRTARAGLIVLQPRPNHLDPDRSNKLFEYMAAGLPVIASDFPRWRELVAGHGCGLLVDPEDPSAIAEAVEWLLTHPREAEEMGRRGRAAVAERFNWRGEAESLLEFYGALAGEPRAPVAEPAMAA